MAKITGVDASRMRQVGDSYTPPDWDALAEEHALARQRRRAVLVAGFGVVFIVFAFGLLLLLGDFGKGGAGEQGVTGVEDEPPPNAVVDLTPFTWITAAVIVVLAVAGVFYLVTRRRYMANQNEGFAAKLKAREEYHQQALEKLRKTTELATLMELNQGQIGEYHRIVTDQADKAFRSSRTAMGVGLLLLVCAAFGGVYVPLEEIRWFIAALAAFSTLLSGYLSRTYMILYRESISQLNRYFDQPVLNSYYLTAERLTQSLDREHVVEIRRQIINEVLATSSRLGAKGADTAPAAVSAKPKKKLPKKQTAKKRVPKQGAPSQNGQAN
ncbi:hypothetical protein [Streptomyces sp. AC555_RSS877]|uniref:hypothetical protein n=1 Tax=Streptomyces sp. AC555_RSS877 TaxID=2823688 RepID=UPI001C27E030|nr:hypothetical protein [Streptomyces sp. AC555_RSS877]